MQRTFFGSGASHRQAGAALVVGLLLLLVLTMLAISGVNSTSLNLVMAGNTQFAQNAFQSAETGIERSMAKNTFNPDPNLAPETQTNDEDEQDETCFRAVSKVQVCGIAQPALPGSSLDSYSTFHFQIESTGCAKRGASAKNIQALALIAPAGDSFAPEETCTVSGEVDGGAYDKLEY